MMRSKRKRLARTKPRMRIYAAKDVTVTIDGVDFGGIDEISYSEKPMSADHEEAYAKYTRVTATMTMTMRSPTATDACGACGRSWDEAHRALEACPDATKQLAP